MGVALIAVEGVLGDDNILQGFSPIMPGLQLIRALKSVYRNVLITRKPDLAGTEQWLLINGIFKPDLYEELRQADSVAVAASVLRSLAHDVTLAVTPNPADALVLTRMGITVLFFVDPAYRWGEYVYSTGGNVPRGWSEIEAEVTEQRRVKAESARSEQ